MTLTVEKKRNLKRIVGIIAFIVSTFLVIHFSQVWLAKENIITHKNIELEGNKITVTLSEKTNTLNDNSQHQKSTTSNNSHYGYLLELYDSTANKSHDKIKFNSPVKEIQNKPQLFVFSSGIIWLVSTSNDMVYDKPGFILKFKIDNKKITPIDFTLDEKYKIRNISDNKVIITNGNTTTGINFDPIFGCTYYDLEKEKIIELPPFDMNKALRK